MAITSIGTRGTQVSGASGTTIARAPSTAVAAGRVLVCQIAQNGNVGTTVTDAQGNDWVFLGSGSGTNARSDIWISTLTTGLSTSNQVTVTFASAIVDKTMLLWEFSVGAGNTLIASTTEVPNSTSGVNGFGSVNFSSLPSVQRLYLRALAKRANITTAITATTNFTTQALTIRSRNNATGAIAQRGEFRINTSTGETSNPTLANTGNTGNVFVALEEFTPPAAQNLTQNTTYSNTNVFYGPTVVLGPAPATNLLPTRYDNVQAFYGPTITQGGGPQTLTAGLFTNNNTFYAATVSRGAVNLTVPLYTNTSVIYDSVVTKGAVNLQPVLYSNTNVFYSATVIAAGANILPPLFVNNSVYYSPTLTTTITLSANRYTQNNTFYNTNVIQNIKFPDWVESGWVEDGWVSWPAFNAPTFFSATVTPGTTFVTPSRFDNTSEFYAPLVELGESILIPSLVTNNTVFFVHNVINEYPDPKYVLKGIMYGPGLVGTYQEGIKVELSTGQLVKPLNSKVAIFL